MCYLVLCEASFPKKLAFAYLEDLQAEFHEQHGKKVPTVSRPYSFIEFGKRNGLNAAALPRIFRKVHVRMHERGRPHTQNRSVFDQLFCKRLVS